MLVIEKIVPLRIVSYTLLAGREFVMGIVTADSLKIFQRLIDDRRKRAFTGISRRT
jgi:hypothetical protein